MTVARSSTQRKRAMSSPIHWWLGSERRDNYQECESQPFTQIPPSEPKITWRSELAGFMRGKQLGFRRCTLKIRCRDIPIAYRQYWTKPYNANMTASRLSQTGAA